MFDKGKVEARRVGNRLDVVMGSKVVIVSGNCRKLPFAQTWDGLRKRVTEIGVLRAAAVARPPAGVHSELHEVGKPPNLLGTCRLAAGQSAKLIQIDGVRAFGNQIRVDEREVADLILGIVVDILCHVRIQLLNRFGVNGIPTPTRDFFVLDSPEFVVLLPQIAFEEFGCRQEPENGYISLRGSIATSFSGESR